MEIILEILKYTIPAGIVFVGVYFVLQSFMDNEHRKTELKFRSDNLSLITPTKLQAYERMVLYLERINLNNLVMRTHTNGMSAKRLQASMLQIIRSEFDHNMAQQLYIPTKTWKLVKSAREEIVKIINNCSDQLGENASGLELSRFILELIGKVETTPTEIAVEALKAEVNTAF